MFDFIRKPLLWDCLDRGYDKEIGGVEYHLKSVQDLAVYARLREAENLRLAEIGGGASRILKRLAKRNDCVNVDKFEGADGGPSKPVRIRGVRNVEAFLGEGSALLPDGAFDVVFSISVIEHVPDAALDAFVEDGLRILKPGGLWLHAIDMYVEDEPGEQPRRRFERYRQWAEDSRFEPEGEVYRGPLAFSCAMASNPDNVMHQWGRLAPKLTALRKRAQSVSLLTALRKR